MKIFDAFCSNGSSWHDKEYFKSDNVIKNDVRKGTFDILGQKIVINPNTSYDMFDDNLIDISADLVYLDPPFLIKNNGIMGKKYTSLGENHLAKLNNMLFKSSLIAKHAIIKFSSNDIELSVLKNIIKKYYYILIENIRNSKNTKNETYFAYLLRK